jgi:hypothetical protein
MTEIVRTPLDKIHTFPLPPADFVPNQATTAELQHFGFPRRPDPTKQPRLAATWDRVLSKKLSFITPEFVHLDDVFPGVRPSPRGVTPGAADGTNSHWSGSVVESEDDGINVVIGSWTVADVYPPAGAGAGSWHEVTWVGIDGWNSPDVCQVGTVAVVSQAGPHKRQAPDIYAWWEWYPNDWVGISNFEVSPGDVLTCVLCATAQFAVYSLVNNTSSEATSFSFGPPQGTALVGNCAEWIVERPESNNQLTELADYGWIYVDECSASTVNGNNFDPGQGNLIEMFDNAGNIISVPTIETQSLLKLNFGPKAE